MNPSTTQQQRARSMMHWMQARAFPTDYLPTAPSTSLPTYNRSSVVEDDVSIFNINARFDVSRTSSEGATRHRSPGGDPCGALAIRPRPQIAVTRSVHRPRPVSLPRGRVRGIFHCRCCAKIVPGFLVKLSPQTASLGVPTRQNRSPFGSLHEYIKRSDSTASLLFFNQLSSRADLPHTPCQRPADHVRFYAAYQKPTDVRAEP